jgi:hypothetical protein
VDILTARRILRDESASATVKFPASMKRRAVSRSPQNIADASAELELAQHRMDPAIERLTDLVIRRRIPDDLSDDGAKTA